MAFIFSRLVRNLMLLYLLFVAVQYALRAKSYSFSPKEFRAMAEKAKGEGVGAVNRLATDLRRVFGPNIASEMSWIPLQAGGLQLKTLVLHGSLTEFILAFNAPFATTGRSGIHFANATCSVLSGSVQRSSDFSHSDSIETFSAGANFRHGQFDSALYSLKEKTYVVCYGRGLVPVSAFWALPGPLLSGDPYSAGRLLYLYGRASFESIAYLTQTSFDHLKKTYLKSEL